MKDLLHSEQLIDYVVDVMVEGLFLLDKDLHIQYMNASARRIIREFSTHEEYIDRYFYDCVDSTLTNDEGGTSRYLLVECIETNKPITGVLREFGDGRAYSLNATPIVVDGKKRGLIFTIEDVSKVKEMERELDMAFALTLPNSKVEHKMKHTVEYKDEFDPDSNKIRIIGIIQDGLYRHVVNSLKILSSLAAQGVTKIIGIDKDELVRSIIFHDLGKAQPELHVGELVDPREAFEPSQMHAFRGAELAKWYYGQSDDVVEIIRYHHHAEEHLPEDFPWRLLPMFRLFQVIDGLSAAVTRGGVEVSFHVNDSTIYVKEKNRRPQYNGCWKINLYTGGRQRTAEWQSSVNHSYNHVVTID